MTEAKVYKRHGLTQMSSSAGDVSDCDYGSGQCELHSGARILWNVDAEENCQFMPYRNFSGKLSVEENKYLWIANDIQLALSFPRDLGSVLSENCAGDEVLVSDQGLAVSDFRLALDPLALNHFEPDLNRTKRRGPRNYTPGVVTQAFLAAQLTSLSATLTRDINFILNHAVTSICRGIVSDINVLRTIMLSQPTLAVRSLLDDSYFYARASQSIVEAFPCYPVTNYTLVPMTDVCYDRIPIKFMLDNDSHSGYMDTLTNIIHGHAREMDCTGGDIPLTLDGKDFLMEPSTADLKEVQNVSRFDQMSLKLSFDEEMSTTVYRNLVIYNWTELIGETKSNDYFHSVDVQREIMEEFGIHLDSQQSTDTLAAHMVSKGMASWLFTGKVTWYHVVDIFCKLWIFGANLYLIIRIVRRCYATRWRRTATPYHIAEVTYVDPEDMVEVSRPQVAPSAPPMETSIDVENECEPVIPPPRQRPPRPKAKFVQKKEPRSAPPSYKTTASAQSEGEEDELTIDVFASMKTNSKITVKVNGMEHRTLVGSGAEVSLIDESLVRLHGLEVRPTKKAARGVTGDALNILGKTQLDVEFDKKFVRTLVMLVVRDCHYDMLLGVDSLSRMGRVTTMLLSFVYNNVYRLYDHVLELGTI